MSIQSNMAPKKQSSISSSADLPPTISCVSTIIYIPKSRTPRLQYNIWMKGELVNISVTNRHSMTTVITTMRAEEVVQSYFVYMAQIVQAATTANVINPAMSTIWLPDCIPVAEETKLTTYDQQSVNTDVRMMLVGYLRPPLQQNIQI